MNTKEIIDRIFKDPTTKYELTEFENLGKPIHDILSVYSKTGTTGPDAGKETPKIIVECKKPRRKDGSEQLILEAVQP